MTPATARHEVGILRGAVPEMQGAVQAARLVPCVDMPRQVAIHVESRSRQIAAALDRSVEGLANATTYLAARAALFEAEGGAGSAGSRFDAQALALLGSGANSARINAIAQGFGNPAMVNAARKHLGQRVGSGLYRGQCMEAVRIWIEDATGLKTGGGGSPAGFVRKWGPPEAGFTKLDTTYSGHSPAGLLPGDVITVYPGNGEATWDQNPYPIHTFIVGDPPTMAIQQNFGGANHNLTVREDLTVEATLRGVLGTKARPDIHVVVLRKALV